MGFWQRILVTTVVFLATAGYFPEALYVSSFWTAVLAAIVLGILNVFVKPILVLFSIPITIMTLGGFYFIVNAFMLELTSFLIGASFRFNNFMVAFLVAIVLSLVNMLITSYISDR